MTDADAVEIRDELVLARDAWCRFAIARLPANADAQLIARWFRDSGGLEHLAASIKSRSRDPFSLWLARHGRTAPGVIGPQPVRVLKALYDAAQLPDCHMCAGNDDESPETGTRSMYRESRGRRHPERDARLSGIPAREAALKVLDAFKQALPHVTSGADAARLVSKTCAKLDALQGDPASRTHFAKSISQMVTALRKRGWIEIALRLLESAIEKGAVDVYILNDAVQCHLAAGDLRAAEAVVAFARGISLATDGMYAALVDKHAKMGRVRRAEELFEEATANGLAADFCHTALIDGYGKLGLLPQAERVFDTARRLGFATIASFTALLDAHGKRGNLTRARELFDEAKVICRERQPIYTALIDAYGKAGEWRAAERLFNELRAIETPSAFAYAALLHAHVKGGNLQRAQQLFDEARARGAATPIAFLTLMKMYRLAGRQDDARRVCEQAKSEGAWP